MKKNWLPNLFQYEFTSRNKNYRHSLFIGLVNPFIQLPHLLFLGFCVPFLFSVIAIVRILIVFPIMGVLGLLDSNFISNSNEGVTRLKESARTMRDS